MRIEKLTELRYIQTLRLEIIITSFRKESIRSYGLLTSSEIGTLIPEQSLVNLQISMLNQLNWWRLAPLLTQPSLILSLGDYANLFSVDPLPVILGENLKFCYLLTFTDCSVSL